MVLSSNVNINTGGVMTNRVNKKAKAVRDVKGQEEKQTQIQVIPGNVGIVQVRLLSEILTELRKLNGGHK